MDERYDIAIVGGGMVGGMLACALGDSGIRVALIEAGRVPEFSHEDEYALRVSALSIASQRMLERIGAWNGIVSRRACVYRHMQVWDNGSNAETQFDSADIAELHLGHIVENHVLQLALCERLVEFDNVDFFPYTRIEDLRIDDDAAHLDLDNNQALTSDLVVAADGGQSKVRSLAGIEITGSRYEDQHALVATVVTELPQQDITWQRFMPAGPQAFLPLCGQRGSVVWYNIPEEVKRLKEIDDDFFVAELERQFPLQLGRISKIIGRGSFPLSHQHVRHYVKPRIALVGDAAHTVHPLAGQGVNLGLLDAATLAEVLVEQRPCSDFGALLPLRRYERWRRGHNTVMQTAVDGFYRVFKSQQSPVRLLRGGMLNAANKLTPVNHLCMRYASGVEGDLPKLARGQTIV